MVAINRSRTTAAVSSVPSGQVSSSSGNGSVWEDAPTEFTRRVTFKEIYGDTGTGRTTLAFTAPGPIAYFHAGEKIEGVIQKAAHKIGPNMDGKRGVVNFGGVFAGSPEQVAAQASALWQRFVAAYFDSYKWARTVIIDTHTELWELIRLARFGGLKPQGGRVDANYGPVNAEFRSLFKHFKTQDTANLIIIGQTKDEYTKKAGRSDGMGERTGRTIRAGMKEIPYMADVLIRTDKGVNDNDELEFTATIEKGWFNASVEGVAMPGMEFASIMELITETPASEWE